MNQATFNQNLGIVEKTLRWTIGALLIGAVIMGLAVPAWLAILATYPVLTAIVSWDPFYAAMGYSKPIPPFRTDRIAGQLS